MKQLNKKREKIMKLIKKIDKKHEYGTYESALKDAGVKYGAIRGAMDILTYIAKDGRNIRVEITAVQYDCDGYVETVNVYEA